MNITLLFLSLYLFCINLYAFFLMRVDKQRAIHHQWRIPEKNLFLSALLGGSLGSLFGMYHFHHKTKHWYFKIGIPAILIFQLFLTLYLLKLIKTKN
ncbi:MAG: DUF1294 domain-containing protein [Lachnospiraceae bacterium]|nr:DUF1294 domain-containing protein [Lachnospiraceae bacterium]